MSVASQGANGQGFFWTVNANRTATLDATGYGSPQFEISTDVDVEPSLLRRAVGADPRYPILYVPRTALSSPIE